MKSGRLGWMALVLGLVGTGQALAQVYDRGGMNSSSGWLDQAPNPPSMLDPAAMDYYRLHSNGIVEYGFAPDGWMSPKPLSLPRPSYSVANLFLRANWADLGLSQEPANFRFVSSERGCDGTDVVTFLQTHNFIPIETSYYRLSVRSQVVTYAEARFVMNTATLPVCQPSGEVQLSYVPQTTQTLVISTEIEQVAEGRRLERFRDACTGVILGFTLYVN